MTHVPGDTMTFLFFFRSGNPDSTVLIRTRKSFVGDSSLSGGNLTFLSS